MPGIGPWNVFDKDHLEDPWPELANLLGFLFTWPPMRQFRTYGAIFTWLMTRFSAHKFVVKPQKLLRMIIVEEQAEAIDLLDLALLNQQGDAMDAEVDQLLPDLANLSIDSNLFPVTMDEALYPDATVERFWGVPRDGDPGDEIAVVVEVASVLGLFKGPANARPEYTGPECGLTSFARGYKKGIRDKFDKYMSRAVEKSGGKEVLGLLFLGAEVLICVASPPGGPNHLPVYHYPYYAEFRDGAGYMPVFDPRLMYHIDRILQIHN